MEKTDDNQEDVWSTGVSLGFLLDQLSQYKNQILHKSTRQVCELLIKPFTFSKKISLAAHWKGEYPTRIGNPQYFISHAWDYSFQDLLKTLENYFKEEKEGDRNCIFIWLDLICVNQHQTKTYDNSFWLSTFQNAIARIGKTIMVLSPWDDPVPLTRAWCIWELYCTLQQETYYFDIAMTRKSEKTFIKDMEDDPMHINAMLAAIDCRSSKCAKVEDREAIHAVIAESIGFDGLNKFIFESMRNWIIRRYEKELECRRVKYLENPEKVVTSLNSMGRLYQHQGNYEKALSCFQECLKMCKSPSSTSSPLIPINDLPPENINMIIRSLNSLAGFYSIMGDNEKALGVQNECIALQDQFPSSEAANEPARIIILNNLGLIHLGLENFEQAQEIFERCISTEKIIFVKNHHFILNCKVNLAAVLIELEDNNGALNLLKKAVKLLTNLRGENNLDTIKANEFLAKLYSREDKVNEAIELYEVCLNRKRLLLGYKHPETMKTLQNLEKLKISSAV
jgi:tetratricopeptide (TPR) repeat protein